MGSWSGPSGSAWRRLSSIALGATNARKKCSSLTCRQRTTRTGCVRAPVVFSLARSFLVHCAARGSALTAWLLCAADFAGNTATDYAGGAERADPQGVGAAACRGWCVAFVVAVRLLDAPDASASAGRMNTRKLRSKTKTDGEVPVAGRKKANRAHALPRVLA